MIQVKDKKLNIVDASAKEFAFHVALSILLLALFAELTNNSYIAFALISFLCFWKIFKATKNICIGCKFYELLKRKNIEVESL